MLQPWPLAGAAVVFGAGVLFTSFGIGVRPIWTLRSLFQTLLFALMLAADGGKGMAVFTLGACGRQRVQIVLNVTGALGHVDDLCRTRRHSHGRACRPPHIVPDFALSVTLT